MDVAMKLTVLGGGGVRTPFLAKSLAMGAKNANLTEIVLMDNDAAKLNTLGAIARRIALLCAPELKVTLTTDARQALTGADYVITTIRAGGDDGRVFDETTSLAHGVLGQETTGAGGFAMALRSIPVLSEYCRLAVEVASPGFLVFNFTNPSGLVTQALRSQGFNMVYGICDAPSEFMKQLHGLTGKPEAAFSARCYGLNHLSWFDEFTLDGRGITDEILQNPNLYTQTEMRLFAPELIELGGNLLPNEYLYFYYYPEQTQNAVGNAQNTRGQAIAQINADMMDEFANLDIENDFEDAFGCFMRHYALRENSYFSIESGQTRPVQMQIPTVQQFVDAPDKGGYSAVALQFIAALGTGGPVRMVLSVPNQNAIEGLAPDDVVEVSCTIGQNGATPDTIGAIPPMQMNLIRQVKLYETLAMQAVLERNEQKAVAALMAHPLVASYPTAKALARIFGTQYREYFGGWA